MPPLQPVTRALLLINVGGVLPAAVARRQRRGAVRAVAARHTHFLPWQVVTYSFLHGNFEHLFFNMLGLWMFGSELERIWGEKRFMQFYAASVLAAAFDAADRHRADGLGLSDRRRLGRPVRPAARVRR